MRFAFNNFVLDTEQCVLWKNGDAIALAPKVFETLQLLVRNAGRIVPKQEFMEALWPDSFVEDGNLTQNIFVLRRVLGSSEEGRSYIETFPRRGYRFVGSVQLEEEIAEAGAPAAIQAEVEGMPGLTPAGAPLVEEPPGQVAISEPVPVPVWHHAAKGWMLVVVSGLVLALMVAGAFALRWKMRMRVGGYQRITNDGKSKDLLGTPSILAVNGDSVYFTEIIGERSVLAQVPGEGGEVSYDPMPTENLHVVGMQPGERGALLMGANWPINPTDPLISKDLSTGATEPVFNIHAQDASWSADGKKLVYAQLGSIFVRSADGTTVLLASLGGLGYWPRWSPDGRTIRFSESYQGFHHRIWQVDSNGGNLHELFANQSDSDHMCCGSWTRSGRGFVYLSIQTNNGSIHIRSEDRGALSEWARPSIDIPAAPLDRWTAPIPAPDGKHIYAIGEQLHGQLIRLDPVTRRAEPFIGGISAEGVSFAPDQENIVWTAYPEGTLWRSRNDGSGRIQLTQTPLIARFPRWSPDGSTIVFTAARPGSDWQLYTVPANGGEVKALAQEPRGQGVATWSPDSKRLAFGHVMDVAEAQNHPFDIEIFRLADRVATPIPGSTGLWTARWSPDGHFLSAVTQDNQTLRLYDMEKGTWTDLAHVKVNDVVWSPDSKSIFFDTSQGVEPTLYRVRMSDRKVEVWASLKNIRRAGFFAPWLGMAPDGSPMLLEDASIQELYSIEVNLP
jgi:DNA-binding winged helix-turn-helix (wHTH) protein/Tol biopolymer transport system component